MIFFKNKKPTNQQKTNKMPSKTDNFVGFWDLSKIQEKSGNCLDLQDT